MPLERKIRTGAFTLNELLVVIVAFTMLAAVLVPVVRNALEKREMEEVLMRGHSIMVAFVGSLLGGEEVDKYSPGLPRSQTYPTSTAAFTNLVGAGWLQVDYSFFAAPTISPYKGTNMAVFKGKNNAWNIVGDLDHQKPDATPFLFTKNLDITKLTEARREVRMPPLVRVDGYGNPAPFGTKGICVSYLGGASRILKPEETLQLDFNAVNATNIVLRAGL